MTQKLWLLLGGGLALYGTQLAACSNDFSSCAANRTCPGGGGGAGEAGSNGEGSGLGGADGGKAGASDAGASEAGAGGAAELGPELFGTCSNKGEIACNGHATAQRLACNGSTWQAGTTCPGHQLCDSTTGKCAAVVAECAAAAPGSAVCRDDQLLICGPDLVSAEEGKVCAGLCREGVCEAPTCGDKKVETVTGEDCDDGDTSNAGACVKCKTAVCGDGAVFEGHEQCDDHNTVSGDGCSALCSAEPIAVAVGESFSCALGSNGVVKCWGNNSHGALGLGDTIARGDGPNEMGHQLPPVELGQGRTATAISASRSNACALLDDGSVKCWGANESGQLGTGDQADRGDAAGEMGDDLKAIPLGAGRSAKAVSIGGTHSCAVLDTGALKCWGAGTAGQLGQGSTARVLLPEQLTAVVLGSGRTALDASAGPETTTCAILDTKAAKCWGNPIFGRLAVDANVDSGNLGGIGDAPGEMAALPPLTFGIGRTVKSIASGLNSSCALLDDGSVKCWGGSFRGQLGQSDSSSHGTTPDDLAALPPVNLGTGRKAKQLSVAQQQECAVLDDGSVKCWGANDYGQLGVGSTDDQGDDDGEMGDALKPVPLGRGALQVSAGYDHTCALLTDHTIKCWGGNLSGQLGLGDTKPRGDSGGVAGVVLAAVDLKF